MMKNLKLIFIFVVLIIFNHSTLASKRCDQTSSFCHFGVFPHSGVRQLYSTYSPIVEDLSILLDVPVKFASKSKLNDYELALTNAEYDFALVGPMMYVRQAAPNGYEILAKSNSQIQFQFITLPDSNINDLNDLKNKKVGLVSNTLKEHLMAYGTVKRLSPEMLELLKIEPVKSPNACIFALRIKKIDACGTIDSILSIIEKQDNMKYKVIASSPHYPGASYVVHEAVDDDVKETLREYFLEKSNFIQAADTDFDVMRELIQ